MNNRTTPKDFFLHLAATVVLYAAAIALINLVFSIINYSYPDVLAGSFYSGSIAWPISMLVVLVPLLYVLEWFIGRDLKQIPEKIEIWIRKWRIYLTLFLSGATIVGDLITLINTYLSGEISSRFVLKVLAIVVICGIIFAYYLLAYKNLAGKGTTWKNILAWLAIIVALAAVIGGFVVVGTPGKQRAIRFDNQRTSDLSNIQWRVIDYWQRTGELPIKLTNLNDPLANYKVSNDPESQKPYEYSVKDTTSFELCAMFNLPTQNTDGKGAYSGRGGSSFVMDNYNGNNSTDSWTHDAGKVCFERKIDVIKYPPGNPQVSGKI